MIGVIADCGIYGMGLSEVMSWQSRVTYLSPILFLCIGVGEKVGKIMKYSEEEILNDLRFIYEKYGELSNFSINSLIHYVWI